MKMLVNLVILQVVDSLAIKLKCLKQFLLCFKLLIR